MAAYPVKQQYTAEDLIAIVSLLRDPVSGCPWDKIQTHHSIRKNFLEETYEVLEAIDADEPAMLCEELGDVMMQVALHTCMEQEKGTFGFAEVCDGVCRKLLYRHPHIFAENEQQSTGLKDWDALKNKEKGRCSLSDELDTVPVTLPALMKAQKTQKRAAGYGVVTSDLGQAGSELRQCEQQMAEALAAAPQPTPPGQAVAVPAAQEQAGAYLFAAVNWLRCAGLDAEEVLEEQISRFRAAHCGD